MALYPAPRNEWLSDLKPTFSRLALSAPLNSSFLQRARCRLPFRILGKERDNRAAEDREIALATPRSTEMMTERGSETSPIPILLKLQTNFGG